MNKIKTLISATVMLSIVTLSFFGCKKEDDDDLVEENPTGKQCVMTSYRLEFFKTGQTHWYEAYTRDAGGNLTKSERFTYPDSNFSSGSNFSYIGNKVNKVISGTIIDSFAYSGNEINKVFVIFTNPRSIFSEYNFEYSNGKLQKAIRRNGTTRKYIDEFRLEWSNENVTKVSTTDSIGTVLSWVAYADYDNANNPMKDFTLGFYTNIRVDVPVFTYLSKNNYGKYTTSSSATRWDIRKIIANTDKYPTIIKSYEYRSSKLSDSVYYHYLYNCK